MLISRMTSLLYSRALFKSRRLNNFMCVQNYKVGVASYTMSDAGSKKARSLNFEGYYNCSREEAKELFRPFVYFDGMYLVRPSESKGALYTLSVT